MGKQLVLTDRALTAKEKSKRCEELKKLNGFVPLYCYIDKDVKEEIVTLAKLKGVSTAFVVNEMLDEKIQEIKCSK